MPDTDGTASRNSIVLPEAPKYPVVPETLTTGRLLLGGQLKADRGIGSSSQVNKDQTSTTATSTTNRQGPSFLSGRLELAPRAGHILTKREQTSLQVFYDYSPHPPPGTSSLAGRLELALRRMRVLSSRESWFMQM